MMNAARQQFEHGFLLWLNDNGGTIFVVADDDGWWKKYADLWQGQEEIVSDPPPPGMVKPSRGFGYLWGRYTEVRDHLGWATADEIPGEGHCHDAGDGDWAISFEDWAEMLEVARPAPPAPEEPPTPTPDPDSLQPLHEQSNYHMVLLPNADDPRIMWNLKPFLYLNLLSDGRVVGELRCPIAGMELPAEITLEAKDGKRLVWFAGEYARGLWAHLLRVAYRPFIAAVDGQ